jgi:cytochrome P450
MVRAIEKTIQSLPTDQQVVRISDWAGRATLDIIGTAAIDLDFGTIQDSNNRLHKEYHRMLQSAEGIDVIITMIIILFSPKYFGWLPTKRTRAVGEGAGYIRSLSHRLIQEKKQRIATGMDTGVDIISVCLKSGGFTDDNLTEQLMTFLAAGHETTATMLQWVVYALCKHPDVQKRLRDEIRSQLHSFDSDQGISTPSIDSLPYLNAVCNEVLRYYPPVPETERIALRNTTVDGTFIPKGTVFVLGHDATNRNKEFWGPDADKFDPDRWMAPGYANTGGATSNYALMTFIHGPRSCIGAGFAKAEMACLVAVLVGKFEMELKDPDSKLEITGFATSKPKDGVLVRLTILEGW